MGYYDRDNPGGDTHPTPPYSNLLGITQGVLNVVVRLTGIGLMAVGLWVGVEVVIEAWALYRDPDRIQVFANALERGMNINAMLAEGWDLAFVTSAVESDAGQKDGNGIFITRFIFRRPITP